ncbi:hypothetical protein P691DRAFT_784169 [Macrolepiota fuliginosa MF-IS2]|uniref:Integral membrane protein n=1 Tax=Macrolepiota fuliginosa MF-IS2 TaxID=1400762 RepID=A0A9P6C052_9AGAR|nr:hypothetical protein P691DRAFT_784169 [Macrolepiota fuliginosa MF-IS2]
MVKLDALTQLRLTCGLCNGIAILTTIFRVSIRFRKSQLWVDDLIAVFVDPSWHDFLPYSLLFESHGISGQITTFSSLRLYFCLPGSFSPPRYIGSARLSPHGKMPKPRNVINLVAVFPSANLSTLMTFPGRVADIISDGTLLFVPIRLFMIIQEKELRYRLIVIFGTCIITTIVSFVHTAFLFEVKETPIIITAVVENAISLVVCNVPIMVATIVKLRKQNTSPISESGDILCFAQGNTTNQQQHQTLYPPYPLRAESQNMNNLRADA